MSVSNKSLVALFIGISVAAFASQASAQPDVNPTPFLTSHGPQLGDHRNAALQKCTDGIEFGSDRYVACMTEEGEAP
jgi:hypothetical protein